MKALASFSIVLTVIVSSSRIDASLAHVQVTCHPARRGL